VSSAGAISLWRRTQCSGKFVKIRVGGYDNETALLRKIPDFAIRTFQQIELRNMSRTGIQFGQSCDELTRKILVEKQLHRATRLPMWAAKS